MSDDNFQLIYQPVPPNDSDEVFASALKDVVAGSKSVAIASPYLSVDVLRPLIEGRGFRLITDQDACFEAGCDPALADLLHTNSEHVRTLAGLHAKVVIGDRAGLFGSANLTTTGLCRRFEMATIVRGCRLTELNAWFEALWDHGTCLDLSTFAKRALQPAVSAQIGHRGVTGLTTTGRLGWLTRSPDQRPPPDVGDVDEELSRSSGVVESEIDELAVRLREFTEDQIAAAQLLSVLARAQEHAGLPVEDERVHLDSGRKNHISVTLEQLAARFMSAASRAMGRTRRENLYRILLDPTLRQAAVRLAHPAAWWFGVNNGWAGHMTLNSMEPLFKGNSLRWPVGNSKTVPRSAYKEMLPGDRVLVWTGHGRDEKWGIVGVAAIERVDDDHMVLSRGVRFDRPLTPYPRRQPAETETVRFLFWVFGESFKPLGDVRQAVYRAGRTNPVTVAKIAEEQVDIVLAHVRESTAE